jgi:hypothetical protein
MEHAGRRRSLVTVATRDPVQTPSGATRPVESVVRHLWDERMSSGQVILGIVTSDEQACSNFRPFSYPIGSAISDRGRTDIRVFPADRIAIRAPRPLNRPARKSRPALLPGPAALLATARRAGSCAQPTVAAAIRRLVDERKLKRASTSLAADKRYIRFFGHYPPSPGAPLSETPGRIWPQHCHCASRRPWPCSIDGRGAEAGAKRPKFEP